MRKITLITFKDCPNAAKTRELLREIGAVFVDVAQDTLSTHHPLRAYSSPTVLWGDVVVFGSPLDAGTSGCSLGLPSAPELRKLLRMEKKSLALSSQALKLDGLEGITECKP